MILEKSIEMMRQRFDDGKFVYGKRPQAAFDDVYNAYVHVPFCMSTCTFCPFYKELYRHVKKCGYMKALLTEIEKTAFEGTILSLNFGGGTPNLLSPDELGTIMDAIRSKARVLSIRMEVLLSLLSEDYIKKLSDIGVRHLDVNFDSHQQAVQLESASRRQRADRADQLAALIKQGEALGLSLNVTLIAGVPEQRETSFIEDVHLLGELGPDEITLQPLIADPASVDERSLELVELGVGILEEKGYSRRTLWSMSKSTPQPGQSGGVADPMKQLPLLGFGPSAYSRLAEWQAINPELDLYIYEQLQGSGHCLWRSYSRDHQEWHQLGKYLFHMNLHPEAPHAHTISLYLKWLRLTGVIKNGGLTEKGIRYAQQLVLGMLSTLPRPIQDNQQIENLERYEAERAFANLYIQQTDMICPQVE